MARVSKEGIMLRTTLVGCVMVVASFSVAQAEDDPLKELGERYTAQEKRYEEVMESAKTDQERKEAFKLSPRNAFVDEFLAIEKSHRGQPAAISALYRLMRHAASVGDPGVPASQGRVKAIQILRDHYLEHPDLNLLFSSFGSGAFVPEAEGLLRDATKSPHRQVRAAALYQLSRFLETKAQLAELFGPNAKALDSTAEEPPAWIEIRRKLREQVTKLAIDPVVERKEAVGLIEQIIAEYPDVVQSFVKQEGPGNLSIRRASPEELGFSAKTYAQYSEALRFELQHLQPGQVAPEITGKDAEGVEFKLSDYRGRVVLLMFSANWCGPCKAMYPDLRKLQAELDREAFAMLAVMGDHKIDSVIHDTEGGDIRWRTWFDGNQGPIATAWNIQGWPTLFLLDHNGTIIDRQLDRTYESLKKAVDRLLAAQKADPKTEEQLKAHPLPELPILKRTGSKPGIPLR
jgi:thiol-disulfide isomerase/thioredoxin